MINFLMIGCLAVYYPALLGNGKDAIQLGFINQLSIGYALQLFVFRIMIVCSSLRVGAKGGLLTPSMANGVLLAAALGGLWNMLWPTISFSAYTVTGAAAFLASAQKMPLTAIILIAEFTNINFNMLVPVLLAVAGSLATFNFFERRFIS